MTDIQLMKDILSVIDEETLNEGMPSPAVVKQIQSYIAKNPSKTIDDVAEFFFSNKGISKSSTKTVFKRAAKAAKAAQAAGNATTGISKLKQWVKQHPTATTLGASGAVTAASSLSNKETTPTSSDGFGSANQETDPANNMDNTAASPEQSNDTIPTKSIEPPNNPTQSNSLSLTSQEEMELNGLAFDLEKMAEHNPTRAAEIQQILKPYYQKYGKN